MGAHRKEQSTAGYGANESNTLEVKLELSWHFLELCSPALPAFPPLEAPTPGQH